MLIYVYKGHEHARIKALARRHGRLDDVVEFGVPHGMQINLMASFDAATLWRVIFDLCGGDDGERNSYWSYGAAKFALTVAEPLRAIHRARESFDALDPGAAEALFDLSASVKASEEGPPVRIPELAAMGWDEPSFADLHRILSDARIFNAFFRALPVLLFRLHRAAGKIAPGTPGRRDFLAAVTRLSLEWERVGRPELEESNAEAGGNNGIRQIVENALAAMAGREYANRGEESLVKEGRITVVDIEGLDPTVHGPLFETTLARLAARTRHAATPSPFSIFVDEANRVLPDRVDLYDDVLRESRVELIVAIQNEAQMHRRFGEERWGAIRGNFRHRYLMEENYSVSIHEGESFVEKVATEALDPTPEETLEAEWAYNARPSLRRAIRERFVLPGGRLPNRFRILHDPRSFSRDASILLIGENGRSWRAEHLGARGMEIYRELSGEGGVQTRGRAKKGANPRFPEA
jgi:hypothetical protein